MTGNPQRGQVGAHSVRVAQFPIHSVITRPCKLLGSYVGVFLLVFPLASNCLAANLTSLYVSNGVNTFVIDNGSVTTSFPVLSSGYSVAAGDTVVIGNLDDSESREYTLSGTATGNTWSGNNAFTQVLDGTTDGVQYNYGIECCGTTNSVIRTNLNWEGSEVLFDLPPAAGSGSRDGFGITYDTSADHIFASFSGTDGLREITEFDLSGNAIGSFTPSFTNSTIVALSYEQATDSLWGIAASTNFLFNFDKSGNQIGNTVTLSGFTTANVLGGEMIISAVPVPGAVWLFGSGLVGLLGLGRRKRYSS